MKNPAVLAPVVLFVFLSAAVSCSLQGNPSPGSNNSSSSSSAPAATVYSYDISWTGPASDSTCSSIKCALITNGWSGNYTLAGSTASGSSNITWKPGSTDILPYILVYATGGSAGTNMPYLFITKPSSQSQAVSAVLSPLGDYATYIDDSHFYLYWSYLTSDTNVVFIIKYYTNAIDSNIEGEETTNTSGSGIQVYLADAMKATGHYEIWLSLLGNKYLLSTGLVPQQ